VIQFHDGLAQDPMLTREKDWSEVKILESTLNQEVDLNYQVEVHDYIHSQVQFQERDNLPKYQCDFLNLEFGQVQMGILKLDLGFDNNMIPRLD